MGKRGPKPKPADRPCSKCGANPRHPPSSWCTPCRVTLNRQAYQAAPAKYAVKQRARRWEQLEKTRADTRAQMRRHRAKTRGSPAVAEKRWRENTHKRYGLTPDAYDSLLRIQGGGCAICAAPRSSDGSRLAVDHCHTTGRVRGLLCARCNLSIGRFEDNAALLRTAATYLERLP